MGLSLRKPLSGGAEIALWRITESEDELRGLLSGHNRIVPDIRNEALRRERLAVLALVDNMFEGRYSLGHLDNGRPYLYIYGRDHVNGGGASASKGADASSVCAEIPHISVSHTGGWAAVAFSPQSEVGIDIESANRSFAAVERKALSDSETSWLCDDGVRLSDGSVGRRGLRNLQLGVIWCAKEAVYKRMGVEVVDFAADMEVDRFEPADAGFLSAAFKAGIGECRRVELQYIIYSGQIVGWTLD